jgi:hypothetical protein
LSISSISSIFLISIYFGVLNNKKKKKKKKYARRQKQEI